MSEDGRTDSARLDRQPRKTSSLRSLREWQVGRFILIIFVKFTSEYINFIEQNSIFEQGFGSHRNDLIALTDHD